MASTYVHLVDDDPISSYTLELLIKLLKADVRLEKHLDSSEALDYFNANLSADTAPDILLIDINMPIVDGWEFADHLLENHAEALKNTDCYILSSSVNTEDVDRAVNHPLIKAYLLKPLEKARVKELLDS